jgi:hypothetical protein
MEPIPSHDLTEDDLTEYYLIWLNILSVDNKSFVARLHLVIVKDTITFCQSMRAFGVTPITYRSRIELFAAALDNVNVPEITEALSRDIMYEIPITENMDILMEPAADAEMRAMSAMKNAAATADA